MIALIITISLMIVDTTLLEEEYPLYRMEEIVVTATRIHQSLRDVPVATTLITRDDIDATNAKDVGELLRGAVGVDIKSYGTPGTESSVSLRGSTSQQVLVLIDGRPVNSVSAGSANLTLISLCNVERIEIVRGPTSHLYGANAMGGVINIITKEPPKELITNTYGSYGTFNNRVFSLEHGGNFGNLGWLITGGLKKSDGSRDNSNYEATNLATKLGYRINNTISANLNLLYHNDNFGVPGSIPPEGTFAKYGNENVISLFDRMKNTDIAGDLTFVWKPNVFSSFTLKNYFDRNKLNYFCRYDDWLTLDTLDEHDEYTTKTTGGSLQYQLDFLRSIVVGGVDVRRINYEAKQTTADLNTDKDTTNNWSPNAVEYGLWLEAQHRILNLVAITSGIRYDFHSQYGSEISPNVGVVYYISDESAIRTSIGKAYRAPSFNDLYWPEGGNPNLKPELGWSFEMGIKHSPYRNLVIDLSLFTRDTKDKIAWAPDTGGIWRPYNLNKHSCGGGEFELNGNLNDKISVGFTYTYLDAKQINKEIVYSDWMTGEVKQELKIRTAAFTPRHIIGANVTITPTTGTQLNLRARFVDKRVNYYPNYDNAPVVTMDTKTLNSYWVMDAKFTQMIIGNLKLEIGMNNIFNKDYMEQFGASFKDRGYPMNGRALNAGASLKF